MADKPFAAFITDGAVDIMQIRHEQDGREMVQAVSQTGQAINDFSLCRVTV